MQKSHFFFYMVLTGFGAVEYFNIVAFPKKISFYEMPEPVIRVKEVDKVYGIWSDSRARLTVPLAQKFGGTSFLPKFIKTPLQNHVRNSFKEFYALNDISLDVFPGDAVGIIGKNGSGKSTLLQIIAGTLQSTRGTVDVRGRVAALLELGSGFNPEFTGRENVYLNATVLGLNRREIDARFEQIADFADIGEFMDQPVKTYSSGMMVRLAFSVQTLVDPDILIVDETLSVGDVFFQAKCIRRLHQYLEGGGTILFVSHDVSTVQRICHRAVLLRQGKIAAIGEPREITALYHTLDQPADSSDETVTLCQAKVSRSGNDFQSVPLLRNTVSGDGSAKIRGICLRDESGRISTCFNSGEVMVAQVMVDILKPMQDFDFGLGLRDKTGQLMGGYHTYYNISGQKIARAEAGDRFLITLRLELSLRPGSYLMIAGVATNFSRAKWTDHDTLWDCCKIDITGQAEFWGAFPLKSSYSQMKV